MLNFQIKKRVDYKLSEAIAPTILYGVGGGFLAFVLGSVIAGAETGFVVLLIWICIAFIMIKNKIEIAKKFTVKDGNKFTIEDVKKQFGTPVNVTNDGKLFYYTFQETSITGGLLGAAFNTTHIFTVDKKGVVVKHEIDL